MVSTGLSPSVQLLDFGTHAHCRCNWSCAGSCSAFRIGFINASLLRCSRAGAGVPSVSSGVGDGKSLSSMQTSRRRLRWSGWLRGRRRITFRWGWYETEARNWSWLVGFHIFLKEFTGFHVVTWLLFWCFSLWCKSLCFNWFGQFYLNFEAFFINVFVQWSDDFCRVCYFAFICVFEENSPFIAESRHTVYVRVYIFEIAVAFLWDKECLNLSFSVQNFRSRTLPYVAWALLALVHILYVISFWVGSAFL